MKKIGLTGRIALMGLMLLGCAQAADLQFSDSSSLRQLAPTTPTATNAKLEEALHQAMAAELLPPAKGIVPLAQAAPGPAQATVVVTPPPTVSYTTNVSVTATTNQPEPRTMTVQEFISSLAATAPAAPAAPAPVQNQNDVVQFIGNALANQSDATNLFAPGEVEFRLGGVYVQSTGEGGTLLSVEKWDVFGKTNFGVGAEAIASGQQQAAEFVYAGYRHTAGNVAGALVLGAGYDQIHKAPLAVIGGRLEYRTSQHLGTWASISYGIEAKSSNSRGMVVGGGINYSF